MLLAASGQAAAQNVPLPRPRPASLLERFATPPQSAPSAPLTTALAPAPELHAPDPTEPAPGPSPCELRLAELAAFTPLPTIAGPGECGAVDVVRLEAVLMPDKSRVTVNPPATLRCSMAEAVATWMRQDVGPSAASLGAPLAAIQNYDSFDCRGRNRVVGARLSEHGKANALDIRALRLADGRVIDPTSPIVSIGFREALRSSACARFMTVLGPGSDGYHESHVHVDLAERRGNYRMCQWDVREPPVLVQVPLPSPRPTAVSEVADEARQ
jgi:hypothetical protein